MRRLTIVLLVAGWVASVVGAFWWGLGHSGTSQVAVPSFTEAVEVNSADGGRSALESEIARLEGLLEQRNRGMLRLVLGRLAESADSGETVHARGEVPPGERRIEDAAIEELVLSANAWGDSENEWTIEGPFYPSDALMIAVMSVNEIARRGAAGIAGLRELAAREVPEATGETGAEVEDQPDSRDQAIEFLGMLRDPKALEALVEVGRHTASREELIGAWMEHLARLPEEDVAPFVPDMAAQLRDSDFTAHPDAAAYLAFRFGDRQAYEMLMRVPVGSLGGAADIANEYHTAEAWQFVSQVARSTSDPEYREYVRKILDKW